jgi:hypothetical protein
MSMSCFECKHAGKEVVANFHCTDCEEDFCEACAGTNSEEQYRQHQSTHPTVSVLLTEILRVGWCLWFYIQLVPSCVSFHPTTAVIHKPRALAKHNILPISSKPAAVGTCATHGDKEQLFCLEPGYCTFLIQASFPHVFQCSLIPLFSRHPHTRRCRIPICGVCSSHGAHRGHHCEILLEVERTERATMETSVYHVREQKEILEQIIVSLDDSEKVRTLTPISIASFFHHRHVFSHLRNLSCALTRFWHAGLVGVARRIYQRPARSP